MKKPKLTCVLPFLLLISLTASNAKAAIITFDNSDFGLSPIFSTVLNFSFSIDIATTLQAGTIYNNPALNSVSYNVNGSLESTPSGFPGFNLVRNIDGTNFYTQGSTFSFTIAATANLSDGLQLSELVADSEGLIFSFNAREFEQFPPRYHPPLFELFNDGTGRIQNSNNKGKPLEVNPGSLMPVNVDFGEEYITDLTFSATEFTIAEPQVVPIPASVVFYLSGLMVFLITKRKIK